MHRYNLGAGTDTYNASSTMFRCRLLSILLQSPLRVGRPRWKPQPSAIMFQTVVGRFTGSWRCSMPGLGSQETTTLASP